MMLLSFQIFGRFAVLTIIIITNDSGLALEESGKCKMRCESAGLTADQIIAFPNIILSHFMCFLCFLFLYT